MATREQHLARVYRDAIAAGLGPEGAKVAVAIATTEHGYEGGVGDTDRSALGSAGTFQLYFGGGQGNNFAAAHKMGEREARDYLKANPHAANEWALTGYLGQKIKAGLARGLRGPDLATFAQGTGGQGSESPERSGANYRAIWSTAQPAITEGAPAGEQAAPAQKRGPPAITEMLGLGARTAEAAELDVSEPTGGKAMPSSYGVEKLPATPADLAAAPVPDTAALTPSATKARIAEQLIDAQNRLGAAQKRVADLEAQPPPDTTVMTKAQATKAAQDRATAVKAANDAATDARKDVARLEKEASTAEDKPAPKTPAKPRVKARDGSVWEQQPDGSWEQQEDIPTGPAATAPKASRTYTAGGAKYTETAPDVGGFGPLPGGVTDDNALTPYQGASLGVAQQNASSSALSAAASMIHAQVAKGTMDFNTAKQVFDYVVAQHAPVEEGGKLYRPGSEPGNVNRQFFGRSVQPYSVVDAAGFYGRPELNQYVHGPYPFGAGPMSPQEYQQRQAGGFQPQPQQPQPSPVGVAVAGPAPVAPVGPDPGLLDQRHGEQMGGGFQPQPTPQAMAAGRYDAQRTVMGAGAPSVGVPTAMDAAQQGQQVLGQQAQITQDALSRQVAQIRDALVSSGTEPGLAERAARQYLGMGATAGTTPY